MITGEGGGHVITGEGWKSRGHVITGEEQRSCDHGGGVSREGVEWEQKSCDHRGHR